MRLLVLAFVAALALAGPSSLTFSHANGGKKQIKYDGSKLIVPDTCSEATCTEHGTKIGDLETLTANFGTRLDALETWRSTMDTWAADVGGRVGIAETDVDSLEAKDLVHAGIHADLRADIDAMELAKGAKGERGVAGVDGNHGSDGAKGERGTDGAQGVKGQMGGDGSRGHKGERGADGNDGSDGTPGSDGAKGHKGATGGSGLRGYKGEKGDAGEDAPTPAPATYGWVKVHAASADNKFASDLTQTQVRLMTSASKVAFAWNKAGSPAAEVSDDGTTLLYDYVAEVTNPQAGQPLAGLWDDTVRTDSRGKQCASAFFSRVAVNCVSDEPCGLPSEMYVGSMGGRVCYNNAIGLVDNAQAGNGQCDWSVDSQSFSALYVGRPSDNGECSLAKTTDGDEFMPSAASVWAWGEIKQPPAAQPQWRLLSKSVIGRMLPDLTAEQRHRMTSASKIAFAWNKAGTEHGPGLLNFDFAVEVTNPQAGQPLASLWSSDVRETFASQSCDSEYFASVSVSCLTGACGLPATMYLGTKAGRVCHNNAVGLVLPGAGQATCDVGDGDASHESVYFGRSHDNGDCSQIATQGGGRYVASVMSIWYQE